MKIISIKLTNHAIMTVGTNADLEQFGGDTAIKSIVFFDQGAYSENKAGIAIFKAYKGPCYVISYTDSDIKTILPMAHISNVTVDSEKTKKAEPQGEEAIAQAEIDNLPVE